MIQYLIHAIHVILQPLAVPFQTRTYCLIFIKKEKNNDVLI